MFELIPRFVLLLIIAYLLIGIVVASTIVAGSVHDPSGRGRTMLTSIAGYAVMALLWPCCLVVYIYLVIADGLFGPPKPRG